MTDKINGCIFCKSPETFIYECNDETSSTTFWVECESCGARGSVSEYKDGAAHYWNGVGAVEQSTAKEKK